MFNELKIFNVTNRADPLLDDLYCEIPAYSWKRLNFQKII